MGRTIKLLLYFFAYQLAFMGVFICGYMIHKGVFEVPQTPDSTYTSLILLAQVLSTAAMGIHLLVGKYVPLDRKTWGYHSSSKVLVTSVVFILALGLWTNYLSELADLPNSMQETFEMMMRHPLGIIAIVIMAPIVEELLFGLVHGNWVQAPFAFVIGLALGWMYYRTGSLLPGILMHFVNNGTAVLGFLITDNPEATMVSEYGPQGAAWMAVAGAVVTVLCVYLFQKKLITQPAVWHEIEEVESQNDENVFIQNK